MPQIDDMHDFLDLFQGPEIDEIEEELKRLGHAGLSAKLNRLSIDAMIDYMAIKTHDYDEQAGLSTARISKDYWPVTLERLDLLKEVHAILPRNPMLNILCDALGELRTKIPASAPSIKPPTFDK